MRLIVAGTCNNFALDNATVAACPIQIDHVRLPLGYRAREKPTDRNALSVATSSFNGFNHHMALEAHAGAGREYRCQRV